MGTPPDTPPPDYRELIVSNIAPIAQTFYLVTQETLDAYASAGFLSNLFLTLFGICTGGFLTCWVAEKTSLLTREVRIALATTKYGRITFGTIFLILSVHFLMKRRKIHSSIFKLPPPEISAKT